MGVAGLALASCDVGGPEREAFGPPLHLVELRAATSLDALGVPVMSALDASSESPALTTTRFELVFDRYLDARTAIRQAVCIRSDTEPVDNFETCSGGVFLRPRYDPTRRLVTYYQEDATVALAPDTLYVVTVLEPRDAGDIGFRAFDGGALEASATFRIRTVAPPTSTPTDSPPAPSIACQTLRETFLGACGGCHNGSGPMGLSLNNLENIQTTTMRVAKQTQVGGNADQAQANPPRFGVAMPIVAPQNPGNSYLLYKILARSPRDPDTLAEGETERLLGPLVTGLPMRPDLDASQQLTEDELDTIVTWIQDGECL